MGIDAKTIVVVSGLPRSGTSLMMQILEAAGLEILSDGIRTADDDNPKGYYELEKVKALEKDASWIGDAEGKVIKAISMLLFQLPEGHEYKIVFMTRRMPEILASQAKMLERLGRENKGPSDAVMTEHYEKHLAKLRNWLAEQQNMQVHYCDYNSLVQDPAKGVESVRAFLGGELDATKMVQVVDPSLHRQRAS